MILEIPDILSAAELELIVSRLALVNFVDGQKTAGRYAKLVKNNQQIDQGDQSAAEIKEIILQAIEGNPLFQAAVLPKTTKDPLISRYEIGMEYGTHIDNALMGDLRADIALTLFLSEPHTYEGGELVVETSWGEQYFKLPAGAAIVYPASTLHRVHPVSAGVRLVAVTWIQSYVRDPARRELLFDLDVVKRSMFNKNGKDTEFDLLSKSHSNLLRMWSEF